MDDDASISAIDATQQMHTLHGQIIRKRCLSKRLIFMDLQREEGTCEVMFKAGIFITIEDIVDIRSRVKGGDFVRIEAITGTINEHAEGFICRSIQVTEKWSDRNPGISFQPVYECIRKRERASVIRQKANPTKIQHAIDESTTDQADETEIAAPAGPSEEVDLEKVCKFWLNSGRCNRVNCIYVHPPESRLGDLRKEWVRIRLENRRQLSAHSEDPFDHHDKKSHHKRAVVFCEWLLQTYGLDYLNSGSGVIDVAGGRGDVTFELYNKHGIKCTLIDPRPMRLRKQHFKHIKLSGSGDLAPQIMDILDDNLLENTQHRELFEKCSILVGMHPDQATEPITDAAVRFGKPFAILPCCVFAKEFPHRRLPCGKQVVLYDEFVDYLCLKDTNVRRLFLDFIGRNQVLYTLPTGMLEPISKVIQDPPQQDNLPPPTLT
eukprot:TRINITY_DN8044_c0_g1_i1.p1 TRINITY_DN8044_c0_g1~~TRINITY_DN8044_c0_g1_i1.p1  ORF type:complete len:435 (-),score=89.26 TRINITY_DN8044_c0_g1_i1:47-1351(-)